MDTPNIYVACLASYNAGTLHGAWIDPTQGITETLVAITAMLKASPEDWAEEYAIHDYEGFGPCTIGEYESIFEVCRLAESIAEHGEAFAVWVEEVASTPWVESDFQDSYRGEWESMADYAESYAEDCGYLEGNNPLAQYVDFEAFGFALQVDGGYTHTNGFLFSS